MHVIIPVLMITAFKAINFNELLCPEGKEIKVDESNFGLLNKYMAPEYEIDEESLNPYEIKGKDCYSAVFKTGCKFHYFGSNDIIQVIEKKTTDKKNCNQVSTDVLTFPEANCVSGLFDNSYHYKEIEYIVTKPRSYMYDPSTGEIVDYKNIFDKKVDNVYHYRDNKGYWTMDETQPATTCDSFKQHESSEIEVKVWKSRMNNKSLIDLGGKIYDVDELCYHDHCGVRIAVTKDHIYFKLPTNLDIKKCSLDYKRVYLQSEIIQEKSELKDCLEAKIDMAWMKSINYEDLRKFNPSSSGIHPVYKLNNNNTLMKALAKYSEVNTTELHKYLEWVRCGNKTKCSYNGVIKADLVEVYGQRLTEKDFAVHVDELKVGIKAYPRDTISHSDHTEEKIYLKSDNSFVSLFFIAAPWISEGILILIIFCILIKYIKPKNKRHRDILLRRNNQDFESW